MYKLSTSFALFLIAFSFHSAPLLACNVPVYRYALERWPADSYEISLCYASPLSENETALANQLIQNSAEGKDGFNYRVTLFDLSSEENLSMKEQLEENGFDAPGLLLRYPAHLGIPSIIETGPLANEYVRSLIQSPLRQTIAARLLEGETAVWLYLESGDGQRDSAFKKTIQNQLQALENSLELPDLSNVEAADTIVLDESAPPLQIKFSFLSLSRTDPKEKTLVNQLLQSERDLQQYKNDPMLFPIFARGRILYALVGEGINAENISEAAEFLVGPCSCLVKDLNPGTDLLSPVNWDEGLKHTLVQDRMVPPPFGLAKVDAASNNPDRSSKTNANEGALADAAPKSSFSKNLWVGIGIIVIMNVVLLFLLARKTTT